ncbi:phosphomannomutase/phosphoglucomutase [Acidithrix sp. C25]|uniref:phosphomannomutase/phosphoglucomutase n=1 Tax=Acidithrix sp. C25 TaxID=1671482 RepID=UPI000AF4389B|nr:phosphomannomutase/phosphoglucomutase [Acidithrix sp. C25]
MDSLDKIFKAYDVRGLAPEELTPEVAEAIGYAFGQFAASERIVVGRDMRPSGIALSESFISGANRAGVGVDEIGLCSTDMLYFASGRLNEPGVTFTASHNPAAYNGIKMCLAGAKPVGEATGLGEIKENARRYLNGEFKEVADSGVNASINNKVDLLEEFSNHIRSFVDVSKLAPLRIVADTANGMGGYVVPSVFGSLPFDLTILYGELDGNFPNHPADPIQPENIADLKNAVVSLNADVGLAFDGDADRVFLVDNNAAPLSGSLTTALVAKAMLERSPGSTVLYNLICSKAVPEVIIESGGVPVMTRVGHSFIKDVMAETGAVFGGEHSGHYYFRDNYRADSGMIAALIILEQISISQTPLSELRKPFERYCDSGEVNTRVSDAHAVIAFIKNAYDKRARATEIDGLTLDFGDWWFNVRPSNTEPLLRLNLEARTQEEVASKLAEVLAVISKADSVRS